MHNALCYPAASITTFIKSNCIPLHWQPCYLCCAQCHLPSLYSSFLHEMPLCPVPSIVLQLMFTIMATCPMSFNSLNVTTEASPEHEDAL